MDDSVSSVLHAGLPSASLDDDGIAFAAEAAVQAMSESDAAQEAAAAAAAAKDEDDDHQVDDDEEEQADQENGLAGDHAEEAAAAAAVCQICLRGNEEGRPLLRFLPVEHDMAAAQAAPGVTSFSQEIPLHIFCGKTASILGSVNRPDLEILTKAGLKNKHGIGPEVNAALARTRCAILAPVGQKEKHFYLVREFEAHLAAIRHTHINYLADTTTTTHPHYHPHHHHYPTPPPPDPFLAAAAVLDGVHPNAPHHLPNPYPQQHVVQLDHLDHAAASKPVVHKAGHSLTKPGRRQSQLAVAATAAAVPTVSADALHPVPTAGAPAPTTPFYEESPSQEGGEGGKIKCGCGGTHLPVGTSRGVASWRSHVTTKRHQKWMEDNGMLGAV